MKLIFDKPLSTVLSYQTKSIVSMFQIGDQIVEAHCPSGGTIAGLSRKKYANLKCYLSVAGTTQANKTRYTVEAISPDEVYLT